MACKDHLGNEYPTIKIMCTAYNISVNKFKGRLRLNWTLEDALTKATFSYTDHLNNHYKTKAEMCGNYGLSYQTYNERIQAGYTQKEALTKPKRPYSR